MSRTEVLRCGASARDARGSGERGSNHFAAPRARFPPVTFKEMGSSQGCEDGFRFPASGLDLKVGARQHGVGMLEKALDRGAGRGEVLGLRHLGPQVMTEGKPLVPPSH